jgi:SAM-dependent methyltransferase
MSRLATAADFEGLQPGALYTEYRRFSFFAARADFIAARWPVSVGRVLVVGAGYGYLVDELLIRGYDAWGLDAAAYAIGKAQEKLSVGASNRVLLGNMATRGDVNAAKNAMGLGNNARVGLLVTEDVLTTCANQQEATVALTELRRHGTNYLHILTCSKPGDVVATVAESQAWDKAQRGDTLTAAEQAAYDALQAKLAASPGGGLRWPGLLWLTRQQWRTLINAPAEVMLDAEGEGAGVEF